MKLKRSDIAPWARASNDRHIGLAGRVGKSAYLLIEALVYIAVSVILIGVAYAAFYQCVENSLGLRRSTDDIANALHAGELWRADVRAGREQIRFTGAETNSIFVLSGGQGEIAYQTTTNAVLRRVGSGPWFPVLGNVKSSTMVSEAREHVTVWRWEVELHQRSKKQGRMRPLFTFMAVPERNPAR